MYTWIKVNVTSLASSNLRGSAICTYLALAANQDEEGVASISYRSIANLFGYTRRSTIEAVAALERAHLIERLTRHPQKKILSVRILQGSRAGEGEPWNRPPTR